MRVVKKPRPDRFVGSRCRDDFPFLRDDQFLSYLDNAATAQKPQAVLDAMQECATDSYANVNRGLYPLGARATELYANARARVAQFINAQPQQIVFTKGATEAINLVAASWGRVNIGPGDEIVLTALEHHANLVPWVLLAKERGATIKVVPLDEKLAVTLDAMAAQLTDRTKLIACAHVSNVLGCTLPVAEICALARSRDITTLIDGCQAVAHGPADVTALDCDFYVFSAHKLYGPSGIGALVGRSDLLNAMPPYQTGGDMVERVSFRDVTFKPAPQRFEAGTPPILEAAGFAAALDYLDSFGWDAITAQQDKLATTTVAVLHYLPGATVHSAGNGIVCFSLAGCAPYDVAVLLGEAGVCIRAGQHCAEPLHETLGVPATLRVSFGLYNDLDDVDALIDGLRRAQAMLA